MRDIVFLFGAGASYGAGGIVPERPPLGSQLFLALRTLFPGSWGSLPTDLALTFGQNFETGMKVVYDGFGAAVPQLMRDMAIYFIQFRPHERVSLYSRLIDDLRNAGKLDRVAFATLNYDCVLEFALASSGQSLAYFSDQSSPSCPVWKLHGSSNFFSAGVQASQGIMYGTGVVFEGGVQAFPDIGEVISHCLVGTGLAPVMSLYMEGKPLGVSPSVVRQIQGFWKDAVASAKVIVLVGVHPNVVDDHVWAPLASTGAGVTAIGDKDALTTWAEHHRAGGTVEWLGARFAEGYPKLVEKVAKA